LFFATQYFIRLLYSFERIDFIKSTWVEGGMMTFILVTGILKYAFHINYLDDFFHLFHFKHHKQVMRVLISVSTLYFAGFEFIKLGEYLNRLTIRPAGTFILSFLFLIALGCGMLMLPEMTTNGQGANFSDAFFTSVSASCVTGLIVVDTATFFTHKGHLVIMLLMQLGGIGIVSFAMFFTTFTKSSFGIKNQAIIQDFLSTDSLHSAKGLLRQIIIITFLIELMAATLLFFSWGDKIQFVSFQEKVFFSVFHGISAFCNAGFSLFSDGLYQDVVRHSYIMHVIIGVTIIIGSLGFSTIQDLFSPKLLRERMDKPWKDWKLGTKISVFTSLSLILIGMLVFGFTEWGNSLSGLSNFEKVVTMFFQSVTTRTAGFNTVDFSKLMTPTIIFMLFLMFIGASSGSTGGGIKTSTFLLILKSSIAAIRGRSEVELGKRHIPNELLFKAMSIFVFAATYNLIMIFLLSISDGDKPILNLVFEQVSAFGTVGLSTGITASLSVFGKWMIITSMFIGRIGTLTLALALSSRVKSNSYSYPNAHIMIG
jgi:potassium uptake TrkH family protein